MCATMGKKRAREGFGNVHKLVNKCFKFVTVGLFVEALCVYLYDVGNWKSCYLVKQLCHAPNTGNCPCFCVKTSNAEYTLCIQRVNPNWVPACYLFLCLSQFRISYFSCRILHPMGFRMTRSVILIRRLAKDPTFSNITIQQFNN